MKKLLILFICLGMVYAGKAQTTLLYNPQANAAKDLKQKLAEAKKENKFLLIQAGGNWCGWCKEFNRFSHANASIDSIINSGYIVYHLNYSNENKNLSVFKRLGFPQRFGFPAFIILNAKGKVLHIQDSGLLEDGAKSYDAHKVSNFLKLWSPAALNPTLYNP